MNTAPAKRYSICFDEAVTDVSRRIAKAAEISEHAAVFLEVLAASEMTAVDDLDETGLRLLALLAARGFVSFSTHMRTTPTAVFVRVTESGRFYAARGRQ